METSQILTAIGLLAGIIGSFIAFRLEMQKFKTETKMKLIELESRISRHEDDNKADFQELKKDNKEDHDKISKSLEKIGASITQIEISIAKNH